MSLNQLFSKLKGGPRSGNWGHAGRPGKKGGSSPGGGFGRIGVSNPKNRDEIIKASRSFRNLPKIKKGKSLDLKDPSEKVKKAIDSMTYDRILQAEGGKEFLQYITALSEYEDNGITFSINSVQGPGWGAGNLSVSADIIKGNKIVGKLEREFYPKAGQVDHQYFKLYPEAQKTGFGVKFYKASEEAYPKLGYKNVTIHANISVGGYAWARMGYDFSDTESKSDIQYRYQSAYAKKYGKMPDTVPDTPWGIASATGPDGYRIGKDALLGSNWYAKKDLDPNSEGWKVGQQYYDSKIN